MIKNKTLSWAKLLTEKIKELNENEKKVLVDTESDFLFYIEDENFDPSIICDFTAWSDNYVFFPLKNDNGKGYIAYVPRNPNSDW